MKGNNDREHVDHRRPDQRMDNGNNPEKRARQEQGSQDVPTEQRSQYHRQREQA